MHITSRSYLTAGIAALGVGAIALTPIQPLPNHGALASEKAVSNLAVQLASSIDPITPWVETFQTSAANIGKLFDFYASNPSYTSPLGLTGNFSAVFPLAQTLIANQMTYLNELFTGNAAVIPEQIVNNVRTFFNAPWSPGAVADEDGNYEGEYISQTVVTNATVGGVPVLPLNQQFAFQLLPSVLGDSWAQVKPIVDFTATYFSGQLVGLLGPVFAPLIELTRAFTAVGEYFNAGDVTGAINELINIPANITNAVLNGGGVLDLTGVANALAPLPPEVKSIGINLGGLISPPVPQDGSLIDATKPPTTFNGGTMFDTVATEIDYKLSPVGPVAKVDDPGIPVSWIGAAVGLGQFLSQEMLVKPPMAATGASVSAAAAEAAPAAVADDPADDADADAAADVTADAADDDATESDAPAAEPAAERNAAAAAGSANSGNETAAKASSRGMSRSAHARGAE